MLKFVVLSALALGLVACIIIMVWRSYLERHDRQVLATRVMMACHELPGARTAEEIHRHILKVHRYACSMGDVRVNLEIMAAEGTLATERDYRPTGNHAQMVHVRTYALTPRHAAGFQ